MQRLTFFVLLALSLLFANTSVAQAPTFITSAEINYTCIGAYTYRVELFVYTECGSSFGNLTTRQQYDVVVQSESSGESFGIKVIKPDAEAEGEIVKIFCEDEPTLCEDPDGYRGLRRFRYEGELNLSGQARAADWAVSWERAFRSYEFEGVLLDVELEPYYAEAVINTLAQSCNTSPVFENEPIIRACIGDPETFRLNATDFNNDGLTYDIVPARSAVETDVVYNGGFSATEPIALNSPLSINSNGEIFVDAVTADQNGVFDIKITETRDGEVIGVIYQGINISSFDCSNEAPEALGFNETSSFELDVCVGSELDSSSVLFGATDADGHRVEITILSILHDGGPFNIASTNSGTQVDPYLFFEWTPAVADTGLYEINVRFDDKGCPTSRSSEQTYSLRVNPLPEFDLGFSHLFECNTPETLDPVVETDNGPVIYQWFQWTVDEDGNILVREDYGTDSTHFSNVSDSIAVDVTDAIGCVWRDTIVLRNTLEPILLVDTTCLGKTSFLYDLSTTVGTDVVSVRWEIEDNGTQILLGDSSEYVFSEEGFFDVMMIVENGFGCVDTTYDRPYVCPHPEPWFTIAGSCSHNDLFRNDMTQGTGIVFSDSTDFKRPFNCFLDFVRWTVIDSSGTKSQPLYNQLEPTGFLPVDLSVLDSGDYWMEWIVFSEAGCIDTAYREFHVDPRPLFDLSTESPVSINCSDPDTNLLGFMLSDHFGTGTVVFNETDTILSDSDSLIVFANETGIFTFTVIDSLECEYTETIEIRTTVEADFVYDTICNAIDSLHFIDSSSSFYPVVAWEWSFGDGGGSIEQHPAYNYIMPINNTVRLIASDSVGCSDTVEVDVLNRMPIDVFSVEPDELVQRICLKDEVTGFIATGTNTSTNVTRIHWDFDDGLTLDYAYPFAYNGLQVSHEFTSLEEVSISAYIEYNNNPFFPERICRRDYEINQPIDLAPEFAGTISDNRTCYGDSAIFLFERTVNEDIPVEFYSWVITEEATFDTLRNSSDSLAVISIDDDFRTNINYAVRLRVEDENGCIQDLTKDFIIDSVTTVSISYLSDCPGDPVTFEIVAPLSGAATDPGSWAFVNLSTNDTITTGFFEANWGEDRPVLNSTHVFNQSGEIPLRFIALKDARIGIECRRLSDTTIYINPAPAPLFAWDTVCANYQRTQFSNGSSIDSGSITSYNWGFGDGDFSSETAPSHLFLIGGYQEITLTATSDSNCVGSLTLDSVYVYPQPNAAFYFTPEFPEAFTPLTFTDDSDPGSGLLIDSSWYVFGDGSDTLFNELDPQYEYDEIAIYFVAHAVENSVGCWDTVAVRTDLNSYLELPNVFSPNGDDANDELALIYKSVYELQTFEIYNRWGQKVLMLKETWIKLGMGRLTERSNHWVFIRQLLKPRVPMISSIILLKM